MPPRTPSKLAGANLPDVLELSGMADEIAASAIRADTLEQVLSALVASGRAAEAARLLAYALPRREAVWWACMCARHSAPATLPEATLAARSLTENWVRQPDEDTGRQAMEAARKAGLQSPESWAALAAFWSGASITPPRTPPVPPAAHLAGTAVASAVALAAVRGNAEKRDTRLTFFLRSAQDIATGGAGRLPMETA
ncbi:hypothetical protein K2X14_15180 [Acetobacter sp. TBRC 12305]|uniref:Uncharacterized protein n=2 Tax=Acetobacter garciniae TaxID=2817435 RepID=A0A939HRM0_9PROT|nr:hypothetical protein [Acetobacter garciniae]MBX0346178.1 hypothetical protein [Acetobacter garciniae]